LSGHKTTSEKILNYKNNIDKHIAFKLTSEEYGKVNFIGLLITRNKDKLAAVIFRNPATNDITIHCVSNQLLKRKLALYRLPLNKMYQCVCRKKVKKK
jgi:hypothetical protein